MASNEKDREDLMRDARALKRRVSFRSNQREDPVFFTQIVLGIRENRYLSAYFDQDPVFHFDERNRLRRAFVDGYLYRTQGTTLARLNRERTRNETILKRHDLDEQELQRFLSRVVDTLKCFLNLLRENEFVFARKIPKDDDALIADLVERLEEIALQKCVLAPVISTKPN